MSQAYQSVRKSSENHIFCSLVVYDNASVCTVCCVQCSSTNRIVWQWNVQKCSMLCGYLRSVAWLYNIIKREREKKRNANRKKTEKNDNHLYDLMKIKSSHITKHWQLYFYLMFGSLYVSVFRSFCLIFFIHCNHRMQVQWMHGICTVQSERARNLMYDVYTRTHTPTRTHACTHTPAWCNV